MADVAEVGDQLRRGDHLEVRADRRQHDGRPLERVHVHGEAGARCGERLDPAPVPHRPPDDVGRRGDVDHNPVPRRDGGDPLADERCRVVGRQVALAEPGTGRDRVGLHVGGVLLGLALLAVMAVGLGALSYTLALASKNTEWLFWTVQQTVLFPLLLLAGILLPVENGPGWLRALSDANPLTYVVDAQRALFNGEFPAGTIAAAAASATIVAALGLAVGTRAMRRSS
ncbi:hypothetical protein E1269_12625 [Jiangella asiatica]|uniref:Transport permease protein n=2 Tax=Jiangella asiatica TaxID=2530372 RepID=A0A4R5DI27_9ACTN|nr:hypothetical protein E1269_12625 [Jiangella asiatica]